MTHDLRVERVYDAAPELVFGAFTDPGAQQEMYADEPDWIVRSECDLRVGGRWTIEFGPPAGPPSLETCVFELIERPGCWCSGPPCRCRTAPASPPALTSRSP